MEKELKYISYQRVVSSELSEQQHAVLAQAKAATAQAYAPYSKFKVGAAVLLSNGEIITGSNQENVAYPSGLCAERTALFYAHHRYPEAKVVMMAVAAFQHDDFLTQPIVPCGACIQVFSESIKRTGQSFEILLYGTATCFFIQDAKALLPFEFDLSE